MKKIIHLRAALLLTVLIVVVSIIDLSFDCGQQARLLRESTDDSVFHSPHKPPAVILPQEVNMFLDSLTSDFESHDLDGVMTHFSEDFLHQGMTKQDFREHISKSYFIKHLKSMTVALVKFEAYDDIADIAGFIETDLGFLLQSSEVLPIAEKSKLRLENGNWRFLGNQEESPVGRFQNFLTIRASLEPQDLKLYRALLPEVFSMPDNPAVWIDITEHQRVSSPLSPYRLGRIQLLASYQDEEGWYVLTLPETAWAPVKFGQTLGYPKYVVDSITLQKTRTGWRGEAGDKGQHLMTLAFTPDPSVATWLEKLTAPSCLTLVRQLLPDYRYKPTFVLMPDSHRKYSVHKIPIAKATVSSFVTPSIVETFGKVRITVNHDAPWAGLFRADTVAKGSLMKFAGDWNLKHRILNDGPENP